MRAQRVVSACLAACQAVFLEGIDVYVTLVGDLAAGEGVVCSRIGVVRDDQHPVSSVI